MPDILSSDWTGLSEILIARFYPVGRDSGYQTTGKEVHAPLTDVEMSIDLNWQSPFETSGADNKAPALTAMVQSGAIGSVMNALRDSGSVTEGGTVDGLLNNKDINDLSSEFRGATGITKLNSTQIFSGMNPIKISMSVKFRAYYSAYEEVELPYRQLLEWALPEELASDGVLSNLIRSNPGNVEEFLKAMLPSRAPALVGFQYKNRTYEPMVIESISEPMDSPIDATGDYTELLVPMTISTLTALDRHDLTKVMSYQGTNSDWDRWWS